MNLKLSDLGRKDSLPPTRHTVRRFYEESVIAVTGGVGSVGAELVAQLLEMDVSEVRVLDNNESALFEAEQKYVDEPRFKAFQGDITNEWETLRAFSGVDYVFHAAALKHVPSCERNPFSAVDTNINGIKSIIRASQSNHVKKVLFTSSDKAVSPTNVMGASKLMGERLFVAANHMSVGPDNGTVFASTRFGNVAGSRGSVVPLFCKQLQRGGPLTLTDERMTRFIMSLREATELVIKSMVYAQGGDTFITKMPSLRVADLTQVLIDVLGPIYGYAPSEIETRIVGARPGEKLWEELSTDEESRRILEGQRYLCVLPAANIMQPDIEDRYKELGLKRAVRVYNSHTEPKMSYDEILDFLMIDGVLPTEVRALISKMRRAQSEAA
ncbi:Polysaccharide biosynthesis protein [Mesorhizobium albiziae]|uniref:Polysaccharide biosynthesis protein n=1 Tax=Neomesorhizobium albiziae TaxID=335020 RepID=A0A1I3ZNX9_9HYPH|nr:polysaccharide biosynthesis protein [Mesorhizobium albiziae]GLS32286.1 membrane protein [Mesorhizobium albiziae]SFK45795.1 Polysaccharide biosynthesis protein [Mesorhizobium albiziae]